MAQVLSPLTKKVLVVKAPRRHVQKYNFLRSFCRNLAEKDHITWWMRTADKRSRGENPVQRPNVYFTGRWDYISMSHKKSKVPEGHHPRGTTLREALRGTLPLKGLCRGLCEGSAGVSAGLCGIFRGFFGGSDPMPVTLGNCWKHWKV